MLELPPWKAELMERKKSQKARNSQVPEWKKELLRRLHTKAEAAKLRMAQDEKAKGTQTVLNEHIMKVSDNIFVRKERTQKISESNYISPSSPTKEYPTSGYHVIRTDNIVIIEKDENDTQLLNGDANAMSHLPDPSTDVEMPESGIVNRLKDKFVDSEAPSTGYQRSRSSGNIFDAVSTPAIQADKSAAAELEKENVPTLTPPAPTTADPPHPRTYSLPAKPVSPKLQHQSRSENNFVKPKPLDFFTPKSFAQARDIHRVTSPTRRVSAPVLNVKTPASESRESGKKVDIASLHSAGSPERVSSSSSVPPPVDVAPPVSSPDYSVDLHSGSRDRIASRQRNVISDYSSSRKDSKKTDSASSKKSASPEKSLLQDSRTKPVARQPIASKEKTQSVKIIENDIGVINHVIAAPPRSSRGVKTSYSNGVRTPSQPKIEPKSPPIQKIDQKPLNFQKSEPKPPVLNSKSDSKSPTYQKLDPKPVNYQKSEPKAPLKTKTDSKSQSVSRTVEPETIGQKMANIDMNQNQENFRVVDLGRTSIDPSLLKSKGAIAANELMKESKTIMVIPRKTSLTPTEQKSKDPVKAPVKISFVEKAKESKKVEAISSSLKTKSPAPQTQEKKADFYGSKPTANALPVSSVDDVIISAEKSKKEEELKSSNVQQTANASRKSPASSNFTKTSTTSTYNKTPAPSNYNKTSEPSNYNKTPSNYNNKTPQVQNATNGKSNLAPVNSSSVSSKPNTQPVFGTKKSGGFGGKSFVIDPSKFRKSSAAPSATNGATNQKNAMTNGSNSRVITPSNQSTANASQTNSDGSAPKGKRKLTVDQIQVIGGYVKLEHSTLSKKRHTNANHFHVKFKQEKLEDVFEYPSEKSLMREDNPMMRDATMNKLPGSGKDSNLGRYTPKYLLSMKEKLASAEEQEDDDSPTPPTLSSPEQESAPSSEYATPLHDAAGFSSTDSADLLF